MKSSWQFDMGTQFDAPLLAEIFSLPLSVLCSCSFVSPTTGNPWLWAHLLSHFLSLSAVLRQVGARGLPCLLWSFHFENQPNSLMLYHQQESCYNSKESQYPIYKLHTTNDLPGWGGPEHSPSEALEMHTCSLSHATTIPPLPAQPGDANELNQGEVIFSSNYTQHNSCVVGGW